MHNQPRRLVENKEKLIFEDDVDRMLKWHELPWSNRFRHVDLDRVAMHQRSRGACARVVDGDGTLTDESAYLCA